MKHQLHLTSFGVGLRSKAGLFIVRYDDPDKGWSVQEIAPLKVESIYLSEHTSVSGTAILLAAEHKIDIWILNKFGMPVSRVWHLNPTGHTKIRKAQVIASVNDIAVDLVKHWLNDKLSNQINVLNKISSTNNNNEVQNAAEQIAFQKIKLDAIEGTLISDTAEAIRGIEGYASKVYFRCLSNLLPEQYQFKERSRSPARDPFNLALNYGYGMLYSKVEKAILLAGLDPYIGFLHRDGFLHQSLTFDLIEPFRPKVDQVVFQLCEQSKILSEHYKIQGKGITLTNEGKQLLIHALNTRFKAKGIIGKVENYCRAAAKSMFEFSE